MAREKIGGGQYWLLIDPLGGTDYSNVICLLSHSFNMTSTTNSNTTYCGTSSTPGDKTASITLSGETMINPDTGEISAPALFDLVNDQTTFSWIITRLNQAPIEGDFTKTGNGYFSSYTEDYAAADSAKFSGTITIDGDVTQVMEGAS